MSDAVLERKLFSLISRLRTEIADFITCIQQDDVMAKEDHTTEMYETLVQLRADAEMLLRELEQYTPNSYVLDKLKQVERIKTHITSLIDILDENPNISDYKEGLLKTVIDDINDVVQSVHAIVQDDATLKQYFPDEQTAARQV